MSYHQSLCLGHTRATSYHQSFCLGHTTAKSYYLQFCHFLKMSCSAKDVATVLRKFQHHAGMSFLHTQVLRKKCSQLVYSCSILYLQNSQSTFISHHLISVWSYQQELHHLLTFSFPSLNVPKWKPVCSFHKLSLIFHKYHMSDLWRDGCICPKCMLSVLMKHTRKNTTCLQQNAELINCANWLQL